MKKNKQEKWSGKDVYEILSNPIYAGVGSFPDAPLPGAIPQLVNDDDWIEAQKRLIEKEGVRKQLSTIRRMLHRSIGMKVVSISHSKWLDESVRSIESGGAEKFFRGFLTQLRPRMDLFFLFIPIAIIALVIGFWVDSSKQTPTADKLFLGQEEINLLKEKSKQAHSTDEKIDFIFDFHSKQLKDLSNNSNCVVIT